ncbi:two-component system, chemotaxis family, response regulator WspR [Gammaproteobacteria bacterium]
MNYPTSLIDTPPPLILLVDDTLTNIFGLVKVLKDDYRLKTATNGSDALQLANASEKPDLILLDVMMPDLDGYEVCRRLKSNLATQDIPIIFVTARSEVSDQEYGFNLGAVDYITKPFELPVVRARIRNHIKLKQKTELLENLAMLDGLTDIPNRRRFDEMIAIEWRRARRNTLPLSVLMVDVDHFKAYNDHYGHGAGDECLRKVARSLKSALMRPADFVARYGGEEFVIILPENNEGGARQMAERIRAAVWDLSIPHAHSPTAKYVTISLGHATRVPGLDDVPEVLLGTADRALYQAKQEGRNRANGC